MEARLHEELLPSANAFAKKMAGIEEARDIMGSFDHYFLFDMADRGKLWLAVEGGSMKAGDGQPPVGREKVFLLRTDPSTTQELLEGRVHLSDVIVGGRLKAEDMSKRPYLSYLGRMIRLGGENK